MLEADDTDHRPGLAGAGKGVAAGCTGTVRQEATGGRAWLVGGGVAGEAKRAGDKPAVAKGPVWI